MSYEDNLTTEWVTTKVGMESQFDRVNFLIGRVRDKVHLEEGEESFDSRNPVLEVMDDVADNSVFLNDVAVPES